MELLDQTRIFCVLFCAGFSLTAAATTSPTTERSVDANSTGDTLWPDYVNFGKRNQFLSNSFITEIPVPYFDIITDYVSINLNGHVSFGNTYSGTVPAPTKWPYSPKILAAYWTTEDVFWSSPMPTAYTYTDSTRLSNVKSESSLIEYIKQVVDQPDFEPLLAFAVTWENVRPKLKDQFPNDTAIFQLLVATDSRVTYAIRGYEQVWQSPELDVQTYYSAAYSRARGERLKISTPGNYTGPEVIPLGTKTPNKDPYRCMQKLQALGAQFNFSTLARTPCPCHMKQAARDPQFKMSGSVPGCYQSDKAVPGSRLIQLCCYNQYGILYNLTKEARVPLSVDTADRTLQEAYETCCAVGSGLCRLFFVQFNRQNCVNNMSLLGTTELPRIVNRDTEITLRASPTENLRNTYAMSFTTNKIPGNYGALTVFNRSHGFELNTQNGRFAWTVSDGLSELRKLSYPQQLVFYMTDTDNISAQFGPLFQLCLCQLISQCKSASFPATLYYPSIELPGYTGPDTYERGNVNLITCECKGNGTGRFCENPSNACDDCLITNSSVCAANPQDYCPPCPLGYHRDGTQCRDNKTTPGPADNGNNDAASIYAISTAQLCIVIILSFLSTSAPWLQISMPITFNRVI